MVRLVVIHLPLSHENDLNEMLENLQFSGKICQVISFTGQQETTQLQFKTKDKYLQRVLDELQSRGVGKSFGQIDVLPVLLSKPGMSFHDQRNTMDCPEDEDSVFGEQESSPKEVRMSIANSHLLPVTKNDVHSGQKNKKTRKKKRRFYRVDDRMTVDEIESFIDDGNHLTFNYMMLLFCASVIAGSGLLGNSATTVIAAMLVSPLMKPILSISFGIATQKADLIYRGVRNEVIGIIISFLTGLIIGAVATAIYPPDYRSAEMVQRGQPTRLVYGFVASSASGIAVVVAISVGGVNAIVGTALSASLLPPIVNSGMCLSMATIYALAADDRWLEDAKQYAIFSVVSLSLFILSFIMIITVGFITFRYIKNVQPHTKDISMVTSFSLSQHQQQENKKTFPARDNLHGAVTTPLHNINVAAPSMAQDGSVSNNDNAAMNRQDSVVSALSSLSTPSNTDKIELQAI